MAAKHYPDVDPSPDFPALEERILAFWKQEGIFRASVEQRTGKPRSSSEAVAHNEFIFYDGPPFANGLPHYGHLLTGFVKDLFARYQTMRGKRVERRFGWDCHGLPAEMGAEKDLGISGRQAIMKYGIDKFNAYCRTSVMKYTHEWESYVTRQARWVDFKNDYKTMDKNFMESVLWAFSQLHNKGLIYEAYRVMPYSWAAETPLSNFETRLDNSYREREDKAITVAFELNTPPKGAPEAKKYYVLAWTTTPWTLPSNLALAVHPGLHYTHIIQGDACYMLGVNTLPQYAQFFRYKEQRETSRCIMRPFTETDLPLLMELHMRPEVAKTTYDGMETPERVKQHLADFIAQQKEHGYSQWAVFEKASGKFIGRSGITIRQMDPSRPPQPEWRVALHPDFWGKGYAREVCLAWQDIMFSEHRLERIVAAAQPDNERAHRLIPTYGFAYEKQVPVRNGTGPYFLYDAVDYWQKQGITGSKLLNLSYRPLFPYFEAHKHAFKILDGSGFVTDADGTGIVHMAPGFGEDDQRVCEANGIELVCPVNGEGKFTDEVFDIVPEAYTELPPLILKGLNVIAENVEKYKFGEANERIIKWFKAREKQNGEKILLKEETIKHNYPHCWRTDQPLIYRAISSWYVEVTKFRDRMVELNRKINWIPGHVRDGLFGKWLEGARDWSISRNRFWGTPIPVWRSDNPKNKELYVFGSIKELETFFNVKVEDLHRPFIDSLTKPDPHDPQYTIRRVEDVFDCWFESGSMPFAQVHYPFPPSTLPPQAGGEGGGHWFESHFPADFIVEYMAQTRGWFYTLMVLSTALFDKPPFKNCICHGVVLDDKGQKLSKRLNNYVDPKDIFDKFGADALRWFMMASPVMRGSELYIDKEGKFIRDVVRLAIKPIWNAYNFFCMYANADGVKAKFATDSTDVMDRYILAKCKQAVEDSRAALDGYDTPAATEAVSAFFEALNNWYIRRNKERFWKETIDADKQAAYDTLYTVLHTMCRASAPLLPLTLEDIYKGLTGEKSVHLADFPDVKEFPSSITDMTRMDAVRDICNAALAVRNRVNIRVRQPLRELVFVGAKPEFDSIAMMDYCKKIIQDEVNVKLIGFAAAINAFATLKLSLNNPVLGKRLPEKMKQIIPASKKGEWKQVAGGVEICGEKLLPEEYTLQLEPKPEYKDRAQALSTNDALVILDTTITPELEAEGLARDMVRLIQQARKDAGLHVSDRINLSLSATDKLASAVKAHEGYIKEQTLAATLSFGAAAKGSFVAENTIEDYKVAIALSKAA